MSAGAKLWVCVDPTAERKLWVPAKGYADGTLAVLDITHQGLCFYGVVDSIAPGNKFTITALAGQGAGKFADAVSPYYAMVFRDAGSLGAAPQGDFRQITAYNTATGEFTTLAFGAAVGVGDEILILSSFYPEIYGIWVYTNLINSHVGDPSTHTLISLTAKWGNIARSLDLLLGARWDGAGDLGTDIADLLAYVDVEGATSLADKLTLARAGYLDNINQAGLLQITAARAGYLDNLSAGAVAQAATALTNATWTDALAAILLNFTAARIGYLDHLIGTVSTGTFSLVNNVNEQDCIVIAAGTQVIDLELDMVNLTQANTVREYVQTDGANYRQISARVFPADFDSLTKAAILSFEQKNALYKVTLQASVAEGAARDVKWRQMVRSLV